MHKVAIVVLVGTESHESLGRVVNALVLAKELQDHDDEVQIVFDGAGTPRGGPWPKAPPDFGTASRQYNLQQTANAL